MKVAIVGGAHSAKDAPFDDKDWQIWVIGNQMQRYEGKRVNRVFEIHENLTEHDKRYPWWLASKNIPMVVSESYPIKCAHQIVFNYKEASKMLGENFSSTPAVMMAQAIMDNATEIAIYGVDMALDDHEYFMQRPAMEQWIGYAKGLGIKVHIPIASPLGKTDYREGRDWPRKGWGGLEESYFSKKEDEHKRQAEAIESDLIKLKQEFDTLNAKYFMHNGAQQAYERMRQIERAKKNGVAVNG